MIKQKCTRLFHYLLHHHHYFELFQPTLLSVPPPYKFLIVFMFVNSCLDYALGPLKPLG